MSLPPPASRRPTIALRDLPVNQDACQGVSFPLVFAGRRADEAAASHPASPGASLGVAVVAASAGSALAYFSATGAGNAAAAVSKLTAPTITAATPAAGGTVALTWGAVTRPRRRSRHLLRHPRRRRAGRQLSRPRRLRPRSPPAPTAASRSANTPTR